MLTTIHIGLFSVCDADGDGFVSREDVIYVTNSLYKFLVSLPSLLMLVLTIVPHSHSVDHSTSLTQC